MADTTRSQLEQAYRLIQQEDVDKAIAILKPITASQPNNLDAWWLLANAVTEPPDAYNALQNVLRINPKHDQARELFDQLKEEFPYLEQNLQSDFADTDASFEDLFSNAAPTPATENSAFSSEDLDSLLGDSSTSSSFSQPNTPEPVAASTRDQGTDSFFSSSGFDSGNNPFDNSFDTPDDSAFSGFDDMFADSEPGFVQDEAIAAPAKPARGRAEPKPRQPKVPKPPKPTRLPQEAVPADPLELERRANRQTSPFVFLIALLFVVVLVGGGLFVAYTAGLFGKPPEPTAAPADSSMFAVPTTDKDVAIKATNAQFSNNNFQKAGADVVLSTLGPTFEVKFCANVGPKLQNSINKALDFVAQETASVRSLVQAGGVQVFSCSEPIVSLYRAVIPLDKVVSYVDGQLKDKRTFRASWQRIES
ncbi:MAG: hypothetical protein ABI947_02065 [Chloroflexota bacterium]